MSPTPQQVLDEVTNVASPLHALYAPHWTKTFGSTVDVGKPNREWRANYLVPDAAKAIYDVLVSTTTGRSKVLTTMSRGEFIAKIAPIVRNITTLSAPLQQSWGLLVTALTGGDDVINISRPEIQGLLDLAVSDGLMSAPYRASLANAGTVACSRAEELGWPASFPFSLVADAKKLEV